MSYVYRSSAPSPFFLVLVWGWVGSECRRVQPCQVRASRDRYQRQGHQHIHRPQFPVLHIQGRVHQLFHGGETIQSQAVFGEFIEPGADGHPEGGVMEHKGVTQGADTPFHRVGQLHPKLPDILEGVEERERIPFTQTHEPRYIRIVTQLVDFHEELLGPGLGGDVGTKVV